MLLQRIHETLHLQHRGHVAQEDPPGAQRAPSAFGLPPGFGEVEEDPVRDQVPEPFGHVAHLQRPLGRGAVVPGHVPLRGPGELLPQLVGDHPAPGPHRPQQREGQGPGSHSRLHHRGPGIDVAPHEDQRQVLGIDHLGLARQVRDQPLQGGPQHHEALLQGGAHGHAVRLAQHVVRGDGAAPDGDGLPGPKRLQVFPVLAVEEDHRLPVAERLPRGPEAVELRRDHGGGVRWKEGAPRTPGAVAGCDEPRSGGEGGIRTPGTLLRYTRFPVVHLKPDSVTSPRSRGRPPEAALRRASSARDTNWTV